MPCDEFAAFRFCCDSVGCVYESDDFSGTLAKWTETAGSWAIVSAAVDTSDADAVLTCDTLHPTPSNKYIVSVTVKFTTDGDVARVYVGDSDYFAEVERITSSCGRLRLYDNTDVTPVCMGSVGVSLSTWTRLVVCSEEDKVHVGTGGSPMLTVPSTVASSIVALGTGACTGTVSFEDFSLSKHYDDDNTCPACGDEGCTWFSYPCVSATTDVTATGTWTFGSSLGGWQCSADGTVAVNTINPQASGKVVFVGNVQYVAPTGTKIRFGLDDSTTYIECESTSGTWRIGLFSAGVQYGVTKWAGLVGIGLTYDGSTVSACIVYQQAGHPEFQSTFAQIAHTITSLSPRVSVISLPGGSTIQTEITYLRKHSDDVASCATCSTPSCTSCSPGTFANHATVTIANITSNAYGCTCTDQTIDLYATATGCQWTGTKSGPCSSGTWTATATITAVSGGYKLTVTVSNSGASATFENTVLSGSPVDCLTAFDGDVPRVSSGGAAAPCTFPSATCTFATP